MENSTLIDLHNKISTVELENILRMQVKKLLAQPELSSKIPPLMIWGAPGLGKSTIIRDVAKEFGIGFIDIRLAQREPIDIRGLPVPTDNGVEWHVSAEWPRDPNSKGIILFDELTAADRSLQVAAYELILDRRLGDLYSLPDQWYICAAGNRVEDAAVSTTMSSALANRFLHFELTEDIDSWIKWAIKNSINPTIIGFLRFCPECLFRQNGENLERGWPTPRSWERVSTMLDIVDREDKSILRKIIYGLIGNRVGVEFLAFHELNEEFDSIYEMMTNPRKQVVIPSKVDRKFALCSAMTYYLWRGKDESEARKLLDGFFRICLKLSSDFASMAMMDAMLGNSNTPSDECVERLFMHKEYKNWAETHGKMLRKRLNLQK